MPSAYSDHVFINCPFDEKFLDIFRAYCFTILDSGFVPRCSLEIDDASQFRLEAIVNMIDDCRYGIHDLSRVELDKASRLPRFNMPFELGIFYSAKRFGNGRHKRKQCIVMERERFRYQKFISDISGIDVKPHKNSVKKATFELRNWLLTSSQRRTIPPPEEIYTRYAKFRRDFQKVCKQRGINDKKMPFIELLQNMTDWLKLNQSLRKALFP